MSDETGRFGGGSTPYEAHLESKRDAIRRAMKNAHLKRAFNPNQKPGIPFYDGAMLRFAAAHYTRAEFHYKTLANFSKFFGIIVLPVGLSLYKYYTDKQKNYDAVQRGEIPYDSLQRFYNRAYY